MINLVCSAPSCLPALGSRAFCLSPLTGILWPSALARPFRIFSKGSSFWRPVPRNATREYTGQSSATLRTRGHTLCSRSRSNAACRYCKPMDRGLDRNVQGQCSFHNRGASRRSCTCQRSTLVALLWEARRPASLQALERLPSLDLCFLRQRVEVRR